MSDLLEIAETVCDSAAVDDDMKALLRDLIYEVEHRDSRVEVAKAILLELEQELDQYTTRYAAGAATLTEVCAAGARVVGARKVVAALEGEG